MRERNLYRGLNDFQGSIDEDGRIYDENHQFVGRIDGNDVYDNCNIRQGSINDDGELWDCNHNFVGMERGNNFIGPSYQSTGMVRGDSFGEGRGSEYGALMMLKKRNRQYSGEILDNDYEFGNDYDGYDDDDGDGYGDGDDYGSDIEDDDGWEDAEPATSCRRARRRHEDYSEIDNDGCSTAVGCLAVIIFVFFLLVLVGSS